MEQDVKVTSENTFAFAFSLQTAIAIGMQFADETHHKAQIKVVRFKTTTTEGTVFFVLGEPHSHD